MLAAAIIIATLVVVYLVARIDKARLSKLSEEERQDEWEGGQW
jgi:hypothetical protein